MPSTPTTAPLDRRLLRIGLVLIGAPILANLDATIVGVATHALAEHFAAPLSAIQWASTGYLLGVAAVMPAAGWASDRFGAKRVWIVAVAMFALGSALSGLAWSVPALIAFRLVQAIGGGLMNPVGQALLARSAGPGQIGRLMSLLSLPITFAPAVGPVLGGVLVDYLDWRWIFYVNLPICLLFVLLALRVVPTEEPADAEATHLDVRGLVLLPVAITALVYGLSVLGDGNVAAVSALALGIVVLAGYVGHALRTRRTPLVDVRLFARRPFAAATVTSFLLGATLYSSMLLVPLYYQQATGASPAMAGLLLAPQALGTALGAFGASRLSARRPARTLIIGGLGLALLGTVAFTEVGASPPGWLLVGSLVVRGVGLGTVMGPNLGAAYAAVEPAQTARAGGAINVVNRVGGSLGTAVLTGILHGQLSGTGAADAFGTTFGWALALSALAFVPAALLPGRPQQDRARDTV